jgi:hypothetical protein
MKEGSVAAKSGGELGRPAEERKKAVLEGKDIFGGKRIFLNGALTLPSSDYSAGCRFESCRAHHERFLILKSLDFSPRLTMQRS